MRIVSVITLVSALAVASLLASPVSVDSLEEITATHMLITTLNSPRLILLNADALLSSSPSAEEIKSTHDALAMMAADGISSVHVISGSDTNRNYLKSPSSSHSNVVFANSDDPKAYVTRLFKENHYSSGIFFGISEDGDIHQIMNGMPEESFYSVVVSSDPPRGTLAKFKLEHDNVINLLRSQFIRAPRSLSFFSLKSKPFY